DARCEPKPVQHSHPRICAGGTGERRTLRSVARYAQHWNLPGGGVDVSRKKREVMEGHCATIGRDPAEITTSTHLRADLKNLGALADEAAAFEEAGLDLGIVYLPPPHRA